jgi:hypothetical protein
MLKGRAVEGGKELVVMLDATGLKAQGTASNLREKRGADDRRGRLFGRTKGGPNTNLDTTGGAPRRRQARDRRHRTSVLAYPLPIG